MFKEKIGQKTKVTDIHVKIADFGLAKFTPKGVVDEAGIRDPSIQVTGGGSSTVGTIEYVHHQRGFIDVAFGQKPQTPSPDLFQLVRLGTCLPKLFGSKNLDILNRNSAHIGQDCPRLQNAALTLHSTAT